MLTAIMTTNSGRRVPNGRPTWITPNPRIIQAAKVSTARIGLIINASMSSGLARDMDLHESQCLTPVSMFPPDHRILCLNRLLTRAGISCQHSTGARRVAICPLANRTDNSASSTSEVGSHKPTFSRADLRKNVLDPENVTNNLNAYFPSLDSR